MREDRGALLHLPNLFLFFLLAFYLLPFQLPVSFCDIPDFDSGRNTPVQIPSETMQEQKSLEISANNRIFTTGHMKKHGRNLGRHNFF